MSLPARATEASGETAAALASLPPVAPKKALIATPRTFLIAMGVYLMIVHVWALWLPAFNEPNLYMGGIATIWRLWLTVIAQTSLAGAHSINLLLLYTVMASVFFLTRFALRGPLWLGSLAAVLLMAHPMKSEAVLRIGGGDELLRALAALLALLAYAIADTADKRRAFIALPLFALAALLLPRNFPVVAVAALYEWLLAQDRGLRRVRVFLLSITGTAAAGFTLWNNAWQLPHWPGLDLQLVLYPIGLESETALLFERMSWLPWLGDAACVAIFLMVYRFTRSQPMLWGLLGALCMRAGAGAMPVNPVTFEGGGGMLVEIALVHISLASICGQIQQHPKWTRHIVTVTTLCCLVYFGLQIQTIRGWHRAAAFTAEMNELMRASIGTTQGKPIFLPWWRSFENIPISLRNPVEHKLLVPFTALPFNYVPGVQIEIESRDGASTTLRCTGANLGNVLGFPPASRGLWQTPNYDDTVLNETGSYKNETRFQQLGPQEALMTIAFPPNADAANLVILTTRNAKS